VLIDSDSEMETRPKQAKAVQGERLSARAPYGVMQQSGLAGNEPQEVGSKNPARQLMKLVTKVTDRLQHLNVNQASKRHYAHTQPKGWVCFSVVFPKLLTT